MQIVRTEVERATAGNGKPTTRVTFRGQGGDSVVVETSGERPDDETAIEKAKALLLQTAVFGDPDRQADGNSTLGPVERQDKDGEWFVFEYRDGDTSRRVPPSLLPGSDPARKEAVRSAVDLLGDLEQELSPSAWLVRVYDEPGALLFTVTKGEAEVAEAAGKDASQ
ncbi:MAG: DUF6894 family protein [Mesorhizobium sp.]